MSEDQGPKGPYGAPNMSILARTAKTVVGSAEGGLAGYGFKGGAMVGQVRRSESPPSNPESGLE